MDQIYQTMDQAYQMLDHFYQILSQHPLSICLIIIVIILYIWMIFKIVFKKNQWIPSENKTILITGCDSGFGYRLAEHFYEKESIVFAGFLNVHGGGAKSLRQKCPDENRFHALQMDVTKDDQVHCAFEYVQKYLENNQLTGLWSLINNAGVCILGEFDWLTTKQCNFLFDINLFGVLRVTKAFLPLIINAKGRIINISSVCSTNPFPGNTIYATSKCAIECFSHSLRQELQRFGVKVVVIKPSILTKHTNIMMGQESHFNEMWNCMGELKQKFYGIEYFNKFRQLVSSGNTITCPDQFEKTKIIENIHEGVYAVNPRIVIISGDLLVKIVMSILYFLPMSLYDKMISFLLSFVFKGKKMFKEDEQENSNNKNDSEKVGSKKDGIKLAEVCIA